MRIWDYQNPLRESLSTSHTNICNHMFQLVFDATCICFVPKYMTTVYLWISTGFKFRPIPNYTQLNDVCWCWL